MARNPTSASLSSRRVNDLLHTLRGEQFRHSQNAIRSRAHISSSHGHNTPTLPADLLGVVISTDDVVTKKEIPAQSTFTKYSGPAPPKSWTPVAQDIRLTAAWRTQALSVIFAHRPSALQDAYLVRSDVPHISVPPLVLFCLKRLLFGFTTSEFTEEIIPCLPPHLRLELIRYASVHSPLSNTKLYALLEPHGHADGELLIVGPSATLKDDYFLRPSDQETLHSQASAVRKDIVEDWDAEDWAPQPLQSLLLLSTHLATSALLALPPTITHLALIDLSTPISLHRLPAICPLIVVLDLSYNTWLNPMSADAAGSVERIDWCRWSRLRKLGWRECTILDGMLDRLNQGRWDDVKIVL